MINLTGTGKRSEAIRQLQRQGRQFTNGRVPGALVSVHPLGTTVEPTGGTGQGSRRRQSASSVPRYG